MPIVADAAVRVSGDLKPFNKDLQGTGKQVDTLGAKIKNTLSPKNLLMGAGAFAAGFASVKLVGFLNDSISAASDLNETVSMTGQIMGDEALPGLEKWAEGAAEAFGQSKQLALDGAATFAVFGKSAGLAGEDLVNFSTDLVELSADMASMKNTSPEEAIQAIGSALRGESEPIRKYGVLLDDATLRQRAMTLGIIETVSDALTPQQKVMAAQAEIFAQTADAQGDYQRTNEGLAGQQKELTALFANFQADLGQKLLPVMTDLMTFANDVGIPALGLLADALGEVADGIGKIVAVRDAIAGTMLSVRNDLDSARDSFHEWVADVTDGLILLGDQVPKVKRGFSELSESEQQAVMDSAATWEEMQGIYSLGVQGAADAVEAGAPAMTTAADTALQDPIIVAMLGGKAEAEKLAGETPGAIAQALLDNQFKAEDAAAELARVTAESIHPLIERMNIIGFLGSADLAAGLNSNDPTIRAASLAMKEAAESRLAELDGLKWGGNFATDLAAGIVNNLGVVRDASRQLAAGMRAPVAIESEPEDHSSPLYGHMKWGGNFVRDLIHSMLGEVGGLRGAAGTVAGALVPSLPRGMDLPAAGALGGAGGPGGLTVYNQLVVDGQPATVGSAQEVYDRWQQMMRLGDRRTLR